MSASAAPGLRTLIDEVSGVTTARAREMRRLGIESVADLLRHLPFRHEFEAAESTIDRLEPGRVVSARGEITACRPVMHGRKRFEAVLVDHTGRLDLVWFNQTWLKDRIRPGVRLLVQGKARRRGPTLQVSNPKWQTIRDEAEPGEKSERLRPIYPASEGVTSEQIEAAVRAVLPSALREVEDHLPTEFRSERGMPPLADAYRMMHTPESEDEVARARRRLAYDELLLLQLGVHMRRAKLRAEFRAEPIQIDERLDARIRQRFPFELTEGQNEALRDIVQDLARETPANRLIQGDVGSGKTVVALYAMLGATAAKRQAAMMAPTELLAEQHFASLSRMLQGSDVRIALLTGSMPESERAGVLAALSSGDVDIAVGTHALLTERVRFSDLAVAVIDEQHRFGVHQRAALRSKMDDARLVPHTLVMTATPIPRTLSLAFFGDLDVSTISGLPPGRQPVATRVVPPERDNEVYEFVRERIDKGQQAYVVVPAIDDSGASGLRDVQSMVKRLESGPLAGKRIASVHGRLKRDTRERRMERFRSGVIDCLVATTVIEVGVDVPNASVMVIEHAERFGLAQLHQLRGRVGRSAGVRAACVLIAEPTTPDAQRRIEAIRTTSDGFALAEVDLELRGPGEMLGARQSGLSPFRVADLNRDYELLRLARRDAAAWIERSPTLSGEDDRLARLRVLKAHGRALGLADVG